ncbi:MAG: hypothetical protein QOE54_517 [Streptosporangiaceae bacterium]|jgi:hypothetical protein|nr:hypothetical protein [Streptosporangiaceae bacterium]
MIANASLLLRTSMRPLAITAATLAILLPNSTSYAEPAAETAHQLLAASCTGVGVKVADNFGDLPVAHGAGHSAVMKTTIRNLSIHSRPGALLNYALMSPTSRWAPTPSLAWRLDKGLWHTLHVRWFGGSGEKYWGSDNVDIGTLKARSTRLLQIRITFHRGDPAAVYTSAAEVAVRPCGTLEWDGGLMHARYRP